MSRIVMMMKSVSVDRSIQGKQKNNSSDNKKETKKEPHFDHAHLRRKDRKVKDFFGNSNDRDWTWCYYL